VNHWLETNYTCPDCRCEVYFHKIDTFDKKDSFEHWFNKEFQNICKSFNIETFQAHFKNNEYITIDRKQYIHYSEFISDMYDSFMKKENPNEIYHQRFGKFYTAILGTVFKFYKKPFFFHDVNDSCKTFVIDAINKTLDLAIYDCGPPLFSSYELYKVLSQLSPLFCEETLTEEDYD
tara:strand:- start:4757 stop:5287 length:531 start_codon:yes stop_codon:yes gene_type:complete